MGLHSIILSSCIYILGGVLYEKQLTDFREIGLKLNLYVSLILMLVPLLFWKDVLLAAYGFTKPFLGHTTLYDYILFFSGFLMYIIALRLKDKNQVSK